MAQKKDAKYSVGYKKPPRHSQFQPGQSGNPHGRPKKADDIADILRRELNARIQVMQNGKRQRLSMLRAIVKQQLNKAAAGDARAMAVLFSMLKSYRPDSGDNLRELAEQFRAIDARLAESDKDHDAKN